MHLKRFISALLTYFALSFTARQLPHMARFTTILTIMLPIPNDTHFIKCMFEPFPGLEPPPRCDFNRHCLRSTKA